MTPPACRFMVFTMVDAQALPRLLGYFSQRDLVPTSVRAELQGAWMTVIIDQHGLAENEATLIAAKMRTSVLVRHVDLSIMPEAAVEGNDGPMEDRAVVPLRR